MSQELEQRLKNAEREIERLTTLCRAACIEILEHWDAHSDEEGYGPINLMDRLAGRRGGEYAQYRNRGDFDRALERVRQSAGTGRDGDH